MIRLKNNLTVTLGYVIHNLENEFVSMKLAVLPTPGTTVTSTASDWKDYEVSIQKDSEFFTSVIGQNLAVIISFIQTQFALYLNGDTYEMSFEAVFEELAKVGIAE